ncbi:hypothetical protein MCHIJ_12590 [Mycolicibacterium chitae]|uniref:ribbon-helix-helix protein, CopG family n=1 Tax=Mycolicibacterium TaxID=1866885 RepID=UPI000F82ABE8|nr:ribbon-helix-helix protein, CopG family [Mycolicibacterium chitae]MCV7105994.1 ribbon-helix-helix protein, CopG family [Mycolicibacterium chitae]BBZ01822.1 hypothetical protein MCHIJ_12590 [Mycolicibacterium chitae]
MRATIRIDDDLYEEVKARAAESGRTVAAVLQDAVRLGLTADAAPRAHRYQVKPIGSGGLRAGVDLSYNAALAELQDNDVP